jgi:outer membrane receptor protein involved in Fe transport
VNYPSGELNGIELVARQHLGHYWEDLEGLSVGANATFIESEVQLSKSERKSFQDPAIDVNIKSRDMTGAPEHLYNFNATYDIAQLGTQVALFYTIKGDTLVAGAGEANGNFVPDLYAKEYGTLNMSISQELSERSKLQFKIKNITNPSIKTAYQGQGVDGEKTHTSYKLGREYSLGLTVRF